MSRRSRPVLICYDIADPKRLRRAFRDLRSVALPVQKSVFVAELTEAELDRLWRRLAEYLDPAEDQLQAYALRDAARPRSLGRTVALSDTWVV
jgi:CRISPR-associated protein Cas2